MSNEGAQLKAVAKIKLTKLDKDGKVICIDEHLVELNKEEVESLWHSQQPV